MSLVVGGGGGGGGGGRGPREVLNLVADAVLEMRRYGCTHL